MTVTRWQQSVLVVLFCVAALAGTTQVVAQGLQLLRNGGFEEDEMSFRGEPAASCGGAVNDQWYNMQDRFPDIWIWPGKCAPSGYGMPGVAEWPLADVTMDPAAPHSGKFAVRLQGKSVSINQAMDFNKVADIYADVGKGGWGTPADHTAEFQVRDGLARDLLLEGWMKCAGIPTNAVGSVSLAFGGVGTTNFSIPTGTVGWTKFQITLPATNQVKALKQGNPGISLAVTLAYTSPDGVGQVWFDDLSVTMAERTEPNLLLNASFERAGDSAKAPATTGRGSDLSGAPTVTAATPYPEGWSKPMKWIYLPPPYYYVWNNWQHFYTACRGFPRLDRMVAHSGGNSLRLDVLPGDEYAIESPAITLNQTEARPIEVTAWVKGDRLRHMDFMLIDEAGRRVNANQTLTHWGGQLSGTHDWVAVRKVFLGFGPIKSCHLRIGGRGFNGQTKPDVGWWHAFNQVATIWVDDVAVREIYSTAAELAQRGVKVPAAETPQGAVRLAALDLGERLYGENEITATVQNDSGRAASAALEVTLVTPSGKEQKAERGGAVKVEAGKSATVTAPYSLTELSPGWKTLGQLRVSLLVGGKPVATETYAYGTWPVVANIRPSKACVDETENPILVTVNLGVAQKTLAKAKKLTVQVIDRRSGKAAIETKIADVPAAIAAAKITPPDKDRFYFYMPRAGLLDHRNLLTTELDLSKLKPRPWDNPENDWIVRVSAGDTFTADSHPFARLTKMNEQLPPVKEVKVDPVGHFLRVNGQPFFVMAQSHANGPGNGGAPKSRAVAFGDERGKNCGMNGAGRWQGISFVSNAYQTLNLYAPMLMAEAPNAAAGLQTRLNDLAAGKVTVWQAGGGGEAPYTLADLNNNQAYLGLFVLMAEGIVSDSPNLRAQEQFADAIRGKINRPIGAMDNHSQVYPWNAEGGFLDHVDMLFMEREEGNLFRPELAIHEWMKRKKEWMMCDLPQTYENVPHARERWQALKNTMNGARGWFGIQGCADPSLYRSLGGELRYIFRYLSANEGSLPVEAPAGISVKAWKKGKQVLVMAEQHNPVPRGQWEWKTGIGGKATPAHTGVSRHLVTPVKEGYAVHGYNDDIYREVATGDVVRQEVYIDKDKPPQAVFVILPGNNDFNHVAYWGAFDWNDFHSKKMDKFLAGECYTMAAYGINNQPTGHAESQDQAFLKFQAEHRFPNSCFVRMGDLPKAGEWATLEVPLEKINLPGRLNDGMMFMSSGNGRAWWGKSVMVRKDGKEEALVDGRIGRDPSQFKTAVLKIAGMTKGTVRVIGENRELTLADGAWTDDLMGEDLYDFFRDGWMGDGITYGQPLDALPGQLELSYTYDDSPRCIRVYEISP